jgi:hypothetical protein
MRRGDALLAMSERVQIAELRQLVVALAQAEKLGVPVAQTMQVQAAELRLKRRQHAEEQAMKLPVKVLFPLMLLHHAVPVHRDHGPGGDLHLPDPLPELSAMSLTTATPNHRPVGARCARR